MTKIIDLTKALVESLRAHAPQGAPEDTMEPREYAMKFGFKPYTVVDRRKGSEGPVELMSWPFRGEAGEMLVLARMTPGDPRSAAYITCKSLLIPQVDGLHRSTTHSQGE